MKAGFVKRMIPNDWDARAALLSGGGKFTLSRA
jgi:hypothetical protein